MERQRPRVPARRWVIRRESFAMGSKQTGACSHLASSRNRVPSIAKVTSISPTLRTFACTRSRPQQRNNSATVRWTAGPGPAASSPPAAASGCTGRSTPGTEWRSGDQSYSDAQPCWSPASKHPERLCRYWLTASAKPPGEDGPVTYPHRGRAASCPMTHGTPRGRTGRQSSPADLWPRSDLRRIAAPAAWPWPAMVAAVQPGC
jgi:hypothetical protein